MTPLLLLEYWVLKQSPQFDDLMLRISWGYQISWSIVCDDSDCVRMNVCNEWSVLYHHNVSRCQWCWVWSRQCVTAALVTVSLFTLHHCHHHPFTPSHAHQPASTNDLTTGWQNLNPLSHPNATLAPQARQTRASGGNLNYVTLAPQARPSGEILNYSLSC